MRGAELYMNFVPQSRDFYVSTNDSYQAFKEGGRIESQKIILGKYEIY